MRFIRITKRSENFCWIVIEIFIRFWREFNAFISQERLFRYDSVETSWLLPTGSDCPDWKWSDLCFFPRKHTSNVVRIFVQNNLVLRLRRTFLHRGLIEMLLNVHFSRVLLSYPRWRCLTVVDSKGTRSVCSTSEKIRVATPIDFSKEGG